MQSPEHSLVKAKLPRQGAVPTLQGSCEIASQTSAMQLLSADATGQVYIRQCIEDAYASSLICCDQLHYAGTLHEKWEWRRYVTWKARDLGSIQIVSCLAALHQ